MDKKFLNVNIIYFENVDKPEGGGRVYHSNQQPWYTSYELPEYVVAYSWVNAKKLEYLARNCGLATILKVLMGKHGFYSGGKSEILKSHFWPE